MKKIVFLLLMIYASAPAQADWLSSFTGWCGDNKLITAGASMIGFAVTVDVVAKLVTRKKDDGTNPKPFAIWAEAKFTPGKLVSIDNATYAPVSRCYEDKEHTDRSAWSSLSVFHQNGKFFTPYYSQQYKNGPIDEQYTDKNYNENYDQQWNSRQKWYGLNPSIKNALIGIGMFTMFTGFAESHSRPKI